MVSRPSNYDPDLCNERHETITKKHEVHDRDIEKLHGRINAVYIMLLGYALAALGTLAAFVLTQVSKVWK
jgi:hypothetical protein